jgi:hypothetical protein
VLEKNKAPGLLGDGDLQSIAFQNQYNAYSIVEQLKWMIRGRKLAGYTFYPDSWDSVYAGFQLEIARVHATHGDRAFECPRSAVLAHEASHAIVAPHDGDKVKNIRIWNHQTFGRTYWVGETVRKGKRFAIAAATPPSFVLTQVCFLIAGIVGEAVLDPAEYREGSSVDEVVVAQLLIANLTTLDDFKHVDPVQWWQACWRRTSSVIIHNEVAARDLITKLSKTKTIRGTPLESALSTVRQLPDGGVESLLAC